MRLKSSILMKEKFKGIVSKSRRTCPSDNTIFTHRSIRLSVQNEGFRGSGINRTTLHWLSPSDPGIRPLSQ